MRLFLDTANLEEIRAGVRMGVVSGVTTNPTLLAREGVLELEAHVRRIAETVAGPVSVEVTATDAEGMVREARQLARWSEHVVVKIPATSAGLEAMHQLRREGIPVNATLVFSVNQALLAALAGATYVSVFLGRVDDVSWDGLAVVRESVEVFRNQGISSQVLAASVRHPLHVLEAARAGCAAVTLPFSVLQQMIRHPLTDVGLERFLADWRKLQGLREAARV
ncbi:MAG: fructose-6-phosphate aldolase [Armatimonadota bacterium]|nr:fructose-6-phosphate aldolase [Armatimonadota bacterium]MDR7565926.1 fructose-6-phosphate aldolase [Armatimonadota bacterium]MDR7578423.1 fructose-6-phosphate aldolase [Armatimonadota bacterium]MDR7580869.1 fructose-6-phosphate aldolase [Armatimonadota bacterium]MDR7595473.1 fructose-6-phosphate aldolase [Armatimonadota bacterium]